ncbi:hypothetical protein [Maricaulis parjimensis]|uniref:hypothetical protein n=1 Tax=Maricaulis parjimensis TaxID=144023 RepID=UPI001939B002|nr:hypothetical protein [Maricaulis parjimensis]
MIKAVNLLPVALIATLTIATPLLAATEPVRSPEVAVIFPPGWDGADVMRAAASADAGVVRFGAWDNILIAQSDDEAVLSRLRQAGAWFFLPPGALGGCLTRPSDLSTPNTSIGTSAHDQS